MRRVTPAAVSATTIAAVLTVGGLAVAAGQPTPVVKPRLGAGVAWLPTDSRGALTAVDLATGRPVAEVTTASAPSGRGAEGATTPVTSAAGGPRAGNGAARQSARLITAGQGSRAAVLDVGTSSLSVLAPDGTSAGEPMSLAAGDFRPTGVVGGTGDGAALVVVDGPHGAFRTVVGTRVGTPRTLPSPITAAVSDGAGVGWLVQGATGSVVGVRGEQVSAPARLCAGGGAPCALTVVDGAAVVVDPSGGQAHRLAFAGADQPPGVEGAGTAASSSTLVVGAPGPALVSLEPGTGTIRVQAPGDVPLLLPSPARKAAAVGSVGDRVVLAEEKAGSVVVVDVSTGRSERIRLHDGRARLQLIRVDDDLVVNDLDSDRAVVVSADRTTPVTKLDAAVAAAAATAGQPAPAPTSSPQLPPTSTAAPTVPPSTGPSTGPTSPAGAPPSATTAPVPPPVPTVPVTPHTVPGASSGQVPVAPQPSSPAGGSAPVPPAATRPPSGQNPTAPTGQNPPAQNPPAQNSAQNPPAQNPPAQTPPAQNPPAQTPPAQTPPAASAAPAVPALQLAPDGETLAVRAQISPGGGGPVTSWTVRLVDQDNRPMPEVTLDAGTRTTRITVDRCGSYSGTVTATGPGGAATSDRVGPVLICDRLGPVTALTAIPLTGTRARVAWTQPAGADGLDQVLTLTPANGAGQVRVSAGQASTVDVAGLTPLTAYTVSVEATDRWGRTAQAATQTRTLPGSVGICGTLLPSPLGSKYGYPYKSWDTCTSRPGGGGPDVRVFTDLSPEQGIDTVLRVYTRPAPNRPAGFDYRLAVTTPAGQPLDTFGVPGADWTPGAVLGYVGSGRVSPLGDQVVAWDGADPVTGADFSWYTDGSTPHFTNGRSLATFAERGRVAGSG